MSKTFKTFIREEETKEKGHPFISALEDELGIDPGDLEKEPQVASFFSLGGTAQNLGPYKVLKFYRNEEGKITHALVQGMKMDGVKSRKYLDRNDKISRVDSEESGEKFVVGIGELDSLLSQSFQPPPQPAGGMV